MALINKPYTFTVGATIVAAEHNNNFDTIYQDYNGNITNANLSGSAAISDSKLAQITTPSKISGAAFTALASIPGGAGLIPNINVIPAMQVTTATRNIALASGTQAVLLSGTSFTPRSAVILSQIDTRFSVGLDDGSTHISLLSNATSKYTTDTSFSVSILGTPGTSTYKGLFNSFNAGGGSITWVRAGGTQSGTVQLLIGFYR